MDLSEKHCQACEGDVPPMHDEEADFLVQDQVPEWTRVGSWIHRDIQFRDFRRAVDFVRDVADLAEDEGHHPDLLIHGYKSVRISLQTHAIGGLSENDFILAAKIDRLHRNAHA